MNKSRIGFIGCGGMSRQHGRVFVNQVPNAQIVALCDTSQKNLDAFVADVFKNSSFRAKTYGDYKKMLEKEKLDGVVIGSPHTQHGPQVLDCLAAGAHVLVEKPMVTNPADAHQIIAAVKKTGRTVSIAFQGIHSPEFAYIRKVIQDGLLGELNLISAVVTQNWKKAVKGTWRLDPKQSGGGQAYDSGAHMFSAILYLSGLWPTEVFAFTDNKGTKVDIITSASIKFQNGCLGSVAVSGDTRHMRECVLVSGTEGHIETGIYGGRLEHWGKNGRVQYPVIPATATLQQNFIDCIRGKATTPATPELGLRQCLLMAALYESARTGKIVKIARK